MKIIATVILSTLLGMTLGFTPDHNKAIIVVNAEVKDYNAWKKGFDAGAPIREKAGIKVLTVASSEEDQNKVIVVEEAASMQAAKDFLVLLKSKQKEDIFVKFDIKLFEIKD
jgi:hypothetical protein